MEDVRRELFLTRGQPLLAPLGEDYSGLTINYCERDKLKKV